LLRIAEVQGGCRRRPCTAGARDPAGNRPGRRRAPGCAGSGRGRDRRSGRTCRSRESSRRALEGTSCPDGARGSRSSEGLLEPPGDSRLPGAGAGRCDNARAPSPALWRINPGQGEKSGDARRLVAVVLKPGVPFGVAGFADEGDRGAGLPSGISMQHRAAARAGESAPPALLADQSDDGQRHTDDERRPEQEHALEPPEPARAHQEDQHEGNPQIEHIPEVSLPERPVLLQRGHSGIRRSPSPIITAIR